MDLTPPSLTRSPTFSPNTNRSSGSPPSYYPSPTLLDQPLYGTGNLPGARASCSMARQLNHTDPSLPPAVPPLQNDRISSEWPPPPNISASTSSSSSAIPNALPLEYDPFASYNSPSQGPFGHEVYSTHMDGQAAGTLQSANHSSGGIARTSAQGPNRTHSAFLHESDVPKIKTEDRSDYGHMDSPHMILSRPSYGADSPGYSGTAHSNYLADHTLPGWSQLHGHQDQSPPYSGSSAHTGPSQELPPPQQQLQQHTRLAKSRKSQRRLTTREEANYQCDVQGCGKLFSRSYNYKAHLETHDEQREYPFPCLVDGCDKKFVRKTDLSRHHQSVHTKERNHRCDYCGRLFARKDTLRRHMEDGCSRRFDLDNLPLRTESYGHLQGGQRDSIRASGGRPVAPGSNGGTLPPLVMPIIGSSDLTPASSRSLRSGVEGVNRTDWPR